MIPSQYSGIGAEPKYLIPRSDGFHSDALEIEGGGVSPQSQYRQNRSYYVIHYFTLTAWKKVNESGIRQGTLWVTRTPPGI